MRPAITSRCLACNSLSEMTTILDLTPGSKRGRIRSWGVGRNGGPLHGALRLGRKVIWECDHNHRNIDAARDCAEAVRHMPSDSHTGEWILNRLASIKPTTGGGVQIKEGGTYKTQQAIWTVETISPSGMVFVRRDDGRRTQFGMKDFANRVIEQVS